ncbi:hypothetical protein K6W36_12330 [Acetobacter senegalensis]|uniref:hypothetical protein n=1 Tax=Acetobacter senegalensis TaxID=446692 RepID=UPI001EDC30FD|nr:hypothetical protein [Acetobacter senegalensis]MCG4261352.1 hypothetical protein [Acetobacter senegalensis]
MKDALIQTAKVVAYVLIIGAFFLTLGTCSEKLGKSECDEKGKALGAEVKFYHDRCYVKGYSDGR